VPNPQSLVTFVTTLFVMLVATRAGLQLDPLIGAGVSAALALALAWVVERNVPDEEVDDITEEAERDASEA
jgi:hypothetical protein